MIIPGLVDDCGRAALLDDHRLHLDRCRLRHARIFGQAIYSQNPGYLAERFPTEVRATASAFCYHQGAIWGGFVPLILSFAATYWGVGLALPMMIGTMAGGLSFALALLCGPETKGKELVAELVVA